MEKTKTLDRILFLGIAFKGLPETNDTRDSVGVKIIKKISKHRKNINFYDLIVKKFLNKNANNKEILTKKYNLIVILNNHPEYKKIAKKIETKNNQILDFWK